MMLLLVIAGCSSNPTKETNQVSSTSNSDLTIKKSSTRVAQDSKEPIQENLIDAKYSEISKAIKLKDWDQVEQHSTHLLGANTKDKVALNSLGLTNLIKKRPKAARYFLNQALAIDSNNSELLNNMGLVSQLEGNSRESIYYWRKALNSNPNNQNAFVNLVAEFSKVKDYRKVTAAAELINVKNLNHVPTLINMAISYSATDKFDEAELFYKKALELDSNNQIVLINLALFYVEHKNNIDLGRKYLDRLSFLGVQSNIQESFKLIEKRISMMPKLEHSK